MTDIRKKVYQLAESLDSRRPERGPAEDTRQAIDTMRGHILMHSDYLWGHEIELPDEVGGGIRLVDRTNNILESFFDGMKHDERRRSGRKSLAQDLEQLPSGAPLAYNLRDPRYVEILCGSMERLPEAFARLDRGKHEALLEEDKLRLDRASDTIAEFRVESASLPRKDRLLVRTEGMKNRVTKAAQSRAPHFPLGRTSTLPATAK